MPYKHQAESFRTINGVRWHSWGDFPQNNALTEKIRLINDGWKVRCFKLDDGMVRIFKHKVNGT